MSAIGRFGRPVGVAFIVALAVFVCLSLVTAVMFFVVVPARSAASVGISPVPFGVPGVAFRSPVAPRDPSGWNLSYVIVNRAATYVLSSRSGAPPSPGGERSRLITLSDDTGHSYDERPDLTFGMLPDATGRFFDVNIFPPLRAGITVVLVHHNLPSGRIVTVRVPVNMKRALAARLPVTTNLSAASGGVTLTVMRIIRGALLSQIDLQAREHATRGMEMASRRVAGPLNLIPAWSPSVVHVRVAAGVDLVSIVGEGPVRGDMAAATIGFRTPPRGSLVTLIVDDYPSSKLGHLDAHTHSWHLVFRMP